MKLITILFLIHAILLLLASTNFTLVTGLWTDSWTWNYMTLSQKSGWGRPYVSDYSFLQVLCYLFCYGLGITTFSLLYTKQNQTLAILTSLLCIAGFLSFLFEATHWLWSHNNSLIISVPVLLMILWIIHAILFLRQHFRMKRAQKLNPTTG